MPYAYTSWWGIDDGSCEQEACMMKLPEGATRIREDYEYQDFTPIEYRAKGISRGECKFRIKVTYGESTNQ